MTAALAVGVSVGVAGIAANRLAVAADPPAAKPPAAQPPAAAPAATAVPNPAVDPIAQWVWGPEAPKTNQPAFLRVGFALPADVGVKSARLWATCDNQCELFVNGKSVGRSDDWQQPVSVDIAAAIKAGPNLVAAQCRNEGGVAAFILKVRIELQNGPVIELASGPQMKASHNGPAGWNTQGFDDSGWKPARVVAPYGKQPWGAVAQGGGGVAGGPARGGSKTTATPAEDLKLLPGFKAELVYSVPKATQGSWVSMCTDPKGRLIVSDQGGPLFRVTPGKGQDDTKVEKIDLPIGHAQGLLWAFDGLYVVVNGGGMAGNGGGLYRLDYDPAKDVFTGVNRLAKFASRGGGTAGGEHGPHAVRLGPDGKLYVVGGNFTRIPDGCSPTSPARNWAEDLLNVRNPDGGGHDPTIWAPAGWVARCDKDGKNWELVLTGLRNAYDFDFNRDGDFFIYDSDMEWDTGSPWYRPTRVLMGVPGGEYGWRNGTGKWPDYYPDSLPAVANMGMGSPTGVAFGYGAKFPAKYQNALYCMDWAYGKLYAVHLTPVGAGYRSTFEPFVEGRGWDGTDVVIGQDGAMYVTIGGRGTQSGLYRITYAGSEPVTPAPKVDVDPAIAEARKSAVWMSGWSGMSNDALDLIWRNLSSQDRYLRFAAGRALERMPLAEWQGKALSETKPTAAV
jgi:glucose/arabinose dehydrogenase